jgi:drug/metabolite transporter (DMT)-like permease
MITSGPYIVVLQNVQNFSMKDSGDAIHEPLEVYGTKNEMDAFWVYIVATVILWGILPVVQVMYARALHISTMAAIFFFLCIAVAPLVYVSFRHIMFDEIKVLSKTKPHVLWLALLGVIITIGSTFTYMRALQASGNKAAIVVVATCAYPLVTAVLMSWLFNDVITPTTWIGILLIIAGCVMVSLPSNGSKPSR